VIYLNGGFTGGETNFLCEDEVLFKDPETDQFCSRKENILESVKPEAGMALIFLHMTRHEGARLTSGTKYILRSDVLFKRENPPLISEEEARARALFRRASDLELENPMEAVKLYQQAFRLSPSLDKNFF